MDRNAEEASSREGLLQAYNNDEKKSTAAHQTREETAESYLSSDESDVDIAEYLKQDRPDDRSKTAPFKHKLNFYTGWKFHYAILAACIISFAAVVTRRFWVHDKAIEYGQSPPWYPSPAGGTVSQWTESYEKAAALVEKMSLPEKINITTGTGWQMGLAVGNTVPAINVGFPALAYQDGPLGLRFADNATAFPAGITVGSTWNKEIMYKRGSAHGLEARLKGVNVLLGPCVGPLGRMPAGGRNWEGFGSDPYLQGVAAAETIKGIQDQHVIATIKHFIGNEQEHFRQARESGLVNALSSNIDDRTLHEIYGWPFQDSVKAGVGSLMCSYQMLNNSYACSNSKLLNGILKDEYGFQGFVQSDWLAQRAGMASALAGLDVTMPGDGQEWANGKSFWGPELTKGVLNGSIPIQRLNDMVTRVVAAWYQMGQDDESYFDRKGPNFSSWTYDEIGIVNFGSPDDKDETIVNQFINVQGTGDDAHSIIARRVATEGTVLVKNDGGILPLSKDGWPSDRDSILRVGVFGEDAGEGNGPNYCVDRGCNQGTLGSGWGSVRSTFSYSKQYQVSRCGIYFNILRESTDGKISIL
jgi:beta-glucosidase